MSKFASPKDSKNWNNNTSLKASRYSSSTSGHVQISGPGRQVSISEYPSLIAQKCFSSRDIKDEHGQLQLVLGMKINGATELLIPANISPFQSKKHIPVESVQDGFRALSPITFATQKALETFLVNHMPQKKGAWSKANKGYETGPNVHDEDSEHSRCSYEHCRLLIRHITSTLPRPPQVYGIPHEQDGGWTGNTAQFLLLASNGYRTYSEKGFLDAAWGVVDHTALEANKSDLENLKPTVKEDFDFGQTLFWGEKGPRANCKHAETIKGVDISDSGSGLKQYIRTYYSQAVDTRSILFVLVHDWSRVKDLLWQLGIDTSSWTTRMINLLKPQRLGASKQEDSRGEYSGSASSSGAGKYKRGRSLSPSRHSSTDSSKPRLDATFRPQIYVIDTKMLYSLVRRSGNLPEGLIDACKDFDMAAIDDLQGWCAGNELQLLWGLFIKMADGPSIDEMFESMFKRKFKRPGYDDDEEEEEEEEEEEDNTPILSGMRSNSNTNKGNKKAPVDFSDDEGGLVSD